jgi:hypothetical protein
MALGNDRNFHVEDCHLLVDHTETPHFIASDNLLMEECVTVFLLDRLTTDPMQ